MNALAESPRVRVYRFPVTWGLRVAFPTRSAGSSWLSPLRESDHSPTNAGRAVSLFLTVIRARVKGSPADHLVT